MSSSPVKAVFDCNVLLQAMISDSGPARACLRLVESGDVELFLCFDILLEVADAGLRPRLRTRFRTTAEGVERYLAEVASRATMLDRPPSVFTAGRDADDHVYVDLAIAVGAVYLVSRDKDLLVLADASTPGGNTLNTIAPNLQVVTPPQFLESMQKTLDQAAEKDAEKELPPADDE